METLALVAAGWLAWTAIEYAGHRWLLHGRGWNYHKRHHARPDAHLGNRTFSPLTELVALLILAVALGWVPALALMAGAVIGQGWLLVAHYGVHRRPGWPLRRLRAHHGAHHADPSRNFGGSVIVWDRLLRTRSESIGGKRNAAEAREERQGGIEQHPHADA